MIAVCLKRHFIEQLEDGKISSARRVRQRRKYTWDRFKGALEGSKDMAKNRRFRMIDGRVLTYEYHKLDLSAFYDKRRVKEDGFHTKPIKCHI